MKQLLYPALLILLAGCSSIGEKEKAKVVLPPPHTETFTLSKESLSTSLKIPAEITAYREVDLYAKVNSYVKILTVDVGSPVKKGQLLATLEAPELLSQMAAAESKYRAQQAVFIQSDATYQRMLTVSRTPGTVSKNDVDIALAKRNSDEAQLQAAQADYKASTSIAQYLQINAPFDGVISARNVNPGAYIGPAGKGSELPIFTLNELRHLRLIFEVPEAYKSYIHLEDTVRFVVRSYPDELFSATIARRAGVMDKLLRSEHVELDVINNDRRLSPGMVAEATIRLSGASAFVVPKTAVVNAPEGVFLIEKTDGKARRTSIRLGRLTDSTAEVFGQQLKEGGTFVTKASEEFHDGNPVN
jgi:membrane fusion protein (multidrug efflux system)